MRNQFISETAIKDTTILNENVDPKLIVPAILESQDIHIQEIIGSSLYNKIDSLIPSGVISQPANVAYKNLLDNYIQPALKYYVQGELVLPMTVKLMNKSIATRSADNASPISLDDMALVRDTFMNKAQWYAERLTNFLRDNTTLYPEYYSSTDSGYSVIRPKGTAYKTNMYLGPDDDECKMLYP